MTSTHVACQQKKEKAVGVFLAQNTRKHRLWLREKRELLTRQDLRDLTRIQMLSSIEQMVELLIPRAGSLLSLNNLRKESALKI